MINVAEWADQWKDAIDVSGLSKKMSPATISEVFAMDYGENDGPPAVALGRLTDGRFFAFSAWRDYTGWG